MKFQRQTCSTCTFIGTGWYDGQEVDFWVCGADGYARSLLARFGNKVAEYYSTTVAGCHDLTGLELAALEQGWEPSPAERDQYFRILLKYRRDAMGRDYFARYAHPNLDKPLAPKASHDQH